MGLLEAYKLHTARISLQGFGQLPKRKNEPSTEAASDSELSGGRGLFKLFFLPAFSLHRKCSRGCFSSLPIPPSISPLLLLLLLSCFSRHRASLDAISWPERGQRKFEVPVAQTFLPRMVIHVHRDRSYKVD